MSATGSIVRQIRWQAHQNSNIEVPENTMAAMRYAWDLGGIPELDIRQTGDGVIVGIHDSTLRRTTDAPAEERDRPIAEMTFGQLQRWDAGLPFGEAFRGERIPSLDDVLAVLAAHPDRELYLDYKEVDLAKMAALIGQRGVGRQIIFAHRDHENCKKVKRLAPEVRTMMWVPGSVPEATIRAYENARETGFDSLDIIQIHLVDDDNRESGWRYRVGRDFLQTVYRQLTEAGMELEVLIARFDQDTLFDLLDLGIRRFAVDEPKVFLQTLDRYPQS
ncbi:glycerophosphodiester phosphodiesterase [Cohnella zeiphila]|uniref:Glycerophosphodiester phosphodiesterase family protein n=1 Tax=Cohnella zeiphila TaxID=2761120 RepID=A0A7X0SKA3_9BACL|nr:glycerophosphodiester phosphodiesterase family protein [Cohnella zeiphila]MBB6731555.1 glycerophosphodiester phosphodiesterase family protein [Cohnella zeiphila]